MEQWIAVLKAADAAARWHVNQTRKGAAKEPYINHLLEVASLVAEATDGKEPELIIAALLHDTIEDQQVSRNVISSAYGEDVAALVEEVTDDKSLPKKERKLRQELGAAHKSRGAKIVKLADKTSNLLAIASSPPSDWAPERRLEYIRWAKRVVAPLRGTNSWLEERFDRAADLAELSIVRLGSAAEVIF
jgi:(p)ppGpp synthase/HD superfamily hydrolase